MKEEFNENKASQMLARMVMLAYKAQEYNLELSEYLRQYNRESKYKNDIYGINKKIEIFATLIKPSISKEQKVNLMEDYEKFGVMIDNFMVVEE